MSDSYVAWSVCVAPSSGIRMCPWHLNWIWGSYCPRWVASSSLDVGGGSWSCLKLLCLALLTPMNGLGKDRGKGTGGEEGWEAVEGM